MASKKHRPEEAVAKLRQVDVLVSQGQTVAEAIRAIGVTEVTYYRWRREFGGLKSDQVKRLLYSGRMAQLLIRCCLLLGMKGPAELSLLSGVGAVAAMLGSERMGGTI